MIIREYEDRDLEEVYSLASSTFEEGYRPEVFSFFHMAWREGQLVIESLDGHLRGFIFGVLGEDRTARVTLLAVHPRFRGMGFGSRLLHEFETRAALAGCKIITLESRASKERLLSFYRKQGFEVVGLLPHYYVNGEDGLLMKKRIQLNI
ncbi:MAG: [ribosomal protein S18]-alanine N-acetyltransferase [Candidatus Methanomethylophilaceae archaeon]|nr:[ribosomal protein S18]-alanine N-acetyltransferase [Candidatus Methanomethylophilaceae archaeon]MDI3541929.1 [ribosomal protein S18]-alanine N-acetyltransferase [Candidatus Methanomethylophilaceae archaeon]